MATIETAIATAADGPGAVSSPGQVLECVPLSSAGKALVTGDADGAALVRRLVDASLEIDALRLFAYLIPIRKAVWWGCLCSWHGNGGKPEILEDESLRAAVAWVRTPGESEWIIAEQSAKGDGCRSPGGCCAQAVGWAGFLSPSGSWTHRDLRVAARLVASSALMVVSRSNPRQLLTLGVEVVRGVNRWE